MKRKLLSTILLALLAVMGAKADPTWSPSTVGAGEFMLYNVGSGKWLNGRNAWGTQASVYETGIFVTLAASGDDYTMSTGSTYSGKYVGIYENVCYVDQNSKAWTFTETSEGSKTYTIGDGTNYLVWDGTGTTSVSYTSTAPTDDKGYWQLVTRANLIANLSNATESNPIDATFFIGDPDFNRNVYPRPWTASGMDIRVQNRLSDTSDNGWEYTAEGWNKNFYAKQTLTGMPAGKYKLKVSGFYDQEAQHAVLYAGDESVKIRYATGRDKPEDQSAAAESFAEGNLVNELEFTLEGSSIEIGVKKETTITNDWCVIDMFRLTFIKPYVSALATPLVSGTSMEADKWYSFTPEVTGTYEFSTATDITFTAADGFSDEVSTTALFTSQNLTGGTTYYFKSTTAQTLYFSIPFEAGDYYIKNVGADRYMNRGHAYKKRSVLDGAGSNITIAKSAAGQYTLKFEDFNNQYFGKDLYVDKTTSNPEYSTWSFLPVGDGKYKIVCNGSAQYLIWEGNQTNSETALSSTNPSSNNEYWSFVTRATRQDLSSASLSNPIDVTYLVANPDFEQYITDGKKTEWNENGWTNNGEFKYHDNNSTVAFGVFKEKWSGAALTDASLSQTLTSLPTGYYRLTADAHAELENSSDDITGVTLYLGGKSVPVSGATATKTVEVRVTSGSVELGMSVSGTNANWVTIDNIRLYYLGNTIELNEANDFSIENDIENVNVNMTRTLAANVWNSLVVPFDMAIPSGWTVMEPTEFTDGALTFGDASSIVAGKPYIVKPTEAVTSFSATGVTLKKDLVNTTVGNLTMTGTYTNIDAIDYASQNSYVVGLKDGVSSLYKVTSAVSLKPFRAYFTIPNGSGARSVISMNFGDNITGINTFENAVDNANAEVMKDGKYIENGRIFVVKNGVKYNINGQIVK